MSQEILRLFRDKDAVVSGGKISSELGITRAAVWKKIKALRGKGYVIHAVPSKGYRLIQCPDLSSEEIFSRVRGDFWKQVRYYNSVDSTNELAMSLSAKGIVQSGTVIIADRQEKGRGRLGRMWISPPGMNIYMSIMLRPDIIPRDVTLITILAALACATALRNRCGLEVSIKWPNDLIVSDKKIGGILTEVRSDPDKINIAVIGIGINVNIERTHLSDEIRSIATSVKNETGKLYQRSGIIIEILNEFESLNNVLKSIGRHPLLEELRRLSSTIGKDIRIASGSGVISGFAEDIDDEGMLILRLPSGIRRVISTGDVTALK